MPSFSLLSSSRQCRNWRLHPSLPPSSDTDSTMPLLRYWAAESSASSPSADVNAAMAAALPIPPVADSPFFKGPALTNCMRHVSTARSHDCHRG
jgi:hypothetical protein